MFQYSKYNIRNTDNFNADDYPKVMNELSEINSSIAGLPDLHKKDIVISYLKEHSLHNDWMTDNPVLAGLFTSGQFVTTHLESLFESCRINNQFTADFEKYIRNTIS